ncbi:MAG: serine/threonine-protein phosphatase [Lachnospiraceae bacterium]|nr:serine/threonine-protein phosphatase [Lachnospiraceae bacterium]
MEYYSTQYWNRGKRRKNEDSLCIEQVMTRKGRVLLAMVCDGIGGLPCGEWASGYVTEELLQWFYTEGMQILRRGTTEQMKQKLKKRVRRIGEELYSYGKQKGIQLGTTMSILLLWKSSYLILHVGDSRIYRIRFCCRLLTRDQVHETGTLLQGVGVRKELMPQMISGRVRHGDCFLLCSDGFYRKQSVRELRRLFGISFRELWSGKKEGYRKEEGMELKLREAAEAGIRRGETDNVSAVWIRCRKGGLL